MRAPKSSRLLFTAVVGFFLWISGRRTSSALLRQRRVEQGIGPQQGRVVGGMDANPYEYQFYVQMERGCGASLIHEDLILTAAHCSFHNISNKVFVGAYYSMIGYQRLTVSYAIHPLFNSTNLGFDFMIMKLDVPVPANEVDPVQLNSDANHPADYEDLTVIGLGVLDYTTSEYPAVLQKARIEALPKSFCSESYRQVWTTSQSMLCAGTEAGGVDSCQGDSGGPLLDSSNIQVGVTSFGRGCGEKQYPGVYSRVSGGIDWIKDQICQMAASPPDYCPNSPIRAAFSQTVDEENATNATSYYEPADTTSGLLQTLLYSNQSSFNNTKVEYLDNNTLTCDSSTFAVRVELVYGMNSTEPSPVWELQNMDKNESVQFQSYNSTNSGPITYEYNNLVSGNYRFYIIKWGCTNYCCRGDSNCYVRFYHTCQDRNSTVTAESLVWYYWKDGSSENQVSFKLLTLLL